jgi:Xaa-Pro aminopeptidase
MTVTQGTDRAERLVSLLPDAHVDVMLVTNLVNVRYLTGYTGSNGLAVVGPRTRAFITDFRYVEQAAEQVDPSFDRHLAPLELSEVLEEVLPQGPFRLGFEETHLSVRDHRRLRQTLPDRVELVGVEGLVERLRAVKDPAEVARIREAARLADDAFEAVIADGGLLGRTERQIALALTREMEARGASRPSFDAIVAAGAHGARPHATPRDLEIGAGELVVIDWGAELDGYCSDCTRTLAAGDVGEREREIYELVLEAQLAGLEAVKAGAEARTVDSAAREIIDGAGYGERFGHGLGHGVGLEVHEAPRLSQRSDAVLAAGNVVTVEPGVYLPDQFGVRIEDLAVVVADGCEVLTSVAKGLTVIG